MKSKQKAILDRIKTLEAAITKSREYLETGANANWVGFQPWFVKKMRHGKALPPHRDWVKNVLAHEANSVRHVARLAPGFA